MKLGKKKTSDTVTKAKSTDKAGAGKKRKESGGTKLRRLAPVAVSQALVVVFAGVVASVLVHFLVIQPAMVERIEAERGYEVDAAMVRLNQHLQLMQESVNGLASRPDVIAAVSGQTERQPVASQLEAALPGIREAHLFSYRAIPHTSNGSGLLGFSGLELARRAETGQARHPDAFPRDNRWFLQMATPVRNPGQ